jgi:glycosyltransferase involved in cell wall biosynthesis
MTHLLVSREYPPSAYPPGGIGTYVRQIARLLAERGETVHVIGELWDGAPNAIERSIDGRLIVHRVPLARPLPWTPADEAAVLEGMAASAFPMQAFSWQAARLAESLIDREGIDIVEAQDFEAPLYYLLLRRSLGLGASRQPPSIVHLHSPWEFVCRANRWPLANEYDITLSRFEGEAIRAADALLCPSRALATQAARHYGLPIDAIARIPYPAGDTPFVERDADIWRRGAICYVGRLEPRKGVFEFVEAAIAAAAERPGLRFEFVGADGTLTGDAGGPSVRAALEARIPRGVASRFDFVGAEPPEALQSRLARAQLVVVPSRWENFPNAAIEAMCSGLPVLASPHGGMAEMIDDGRTGWLAASSHAADLLSALRRALDTAPDARARMGRAAAAAIRRTCDNASIVEQHLSFKQRLVRRGTTPPAASIDPIPQTSATADVAVVVTGGAERELDACLSSIARQTRAPAAVVVMEERPAPAQGQADWRRILHERQWTAIDARGAPADRARAIGVRAALERGTAAVAFVDARWQVDPTFLQACEAALARDDRVGLVSSWSTEGDRVVVRPGPARPYQWFLNDASDCIVVRTMALRKLAWLDDLSYPVPAPADLALAVLAQGWTAVGHPTPLSRRPTASPRPSPRRLPVLLFEHRPEAIADDLPRLFPLIEARGSQVSRRRTTGSMTPIAALRQPLPAQWALIARALRQPRYAAAWIGWHGRRTWRRVRARLLRLPARK